VLDDNSDIAATANTPITPAMHPLKNAHTFPLLSFLGIISSVIDILLHGLKYNKRNRDTQSSL
jgi:hypothetical protein